MCMYSLFSQGNSRFLSSCYALLDTRCIFQEDVKFRFVVVWIFPFPKQNQQSGLLFKKELFSSNKLSSVQKLLHILKRNYSQKSGISRLCISTGCLVLFKHMIMFKKEVFESPSNGEKDSRTRYVWKATPCLERT